MCMRWMQLDLPGYNFLPGYLAAEHFKFSGWISYELTHYKDVDGGTLCNFDYVFLVILVFLVQDNHVASAEIAVLVWKRCALGANNAFSVGT